MDATERRMLLAIGRPDESPYVELALDDAGVRVAVR
jgi:hypothetical protein